MCWRWVGKKISSSVDFNSPSNQNEVKYFIINVRRNGSYKNDIETSKKPNSKEKTQLKFAI